MLRSFRYQTGEMEDIVQEIKEGKIPCMDVYDSDEMDWVIGQLASQGIIKAEDIPHDRNARDTEKEPEFEFRVAFRHTINGQEELCYIDFYFEPEVEESYPQIGFD